MTSTTTPQQSLEDIQRKLASGDLPAAGDMLDKLLPEFLNDPNGATHEDEQQIAGGAL